MFGLLKESSCKHWFLELADHTKFARSNVVTMGKGCGDCFFYYGFVGRKGFYTVSDWILEITIVDVNVFSPVLFESFNILCGEWGCEGRSRHGKQYKATLRNIFGLKFAVRDYFFISKEIESSKFGSFVVWVVDGPYFPFSCRQRPFVMLPNIDIALLYCCPAVDHTERLNFTSCFCNHLSIQIKLKSKLRVQSTSFFFFNVELREERTFKHVRHLISLSFFNFCP